MTRRFRTADYEETLDLQISLRDALPPDHLARFVVDVIAQLDLSGIYKQYSDQGAPPYAPEVMLGLLFYGYAVGVFSARKVEKATYEVIPFDCYPKEYEEDIIGEVMSYKHWIVHRTDLDMAHLAEMTRMQLWTLKPAIER